MKKKIIKTIFLGTIISSLFSFNAFAEDGSWEYIDSTTETTTPETTVTKQ